MQLQSLCDDYFALSLTVEPFAATMLGYHEYDAEVPDVSVAGQARMRAAFVELRDRAAALKDTGLSEVDETSRAMIETMTADAIADIDGRDVDFTVTPFWFGAQAQVLTWLPKTELADQTQAQDYVERCRKLSGFLAESAMRLRDGLRDGLLPVAAGVAGSIEQIEGYLAIPLEEDPLLGPLQALPADAELMSRAEHTVRTMVRPAMEAFADVLRLEIAPHARPDDKPGLVWLPDGAARYSALARKHTTTTLTPQELHDLGMRELARLDDEYRALGKTALGTDDLQEIFDRLREDQSLRFSNANDVMVAAQTAIERATKALPEWFGVLPDAAIDVREIPEMEAKGSTIAYYTPPPETGDGPGVYWVNTSNAAAMYEAEAVAFHEALPGHHLQIAIAQRLRDLPDFRRYAGVTSYVEGWGLYTERLADEMGLYSSDLARMGMLSLDSLRAGRLVMDTGLHALGWSRAQTIEFMVSRSPLDAQVVEAEVERYISYPGQALGYMVGRLEILRMREAARERMGERFDIRGFHDVVLGSGAVPLTVLDALITAWSNAETVS